MKKRFGAALLVLLFALVMGMGVAPATAAVSPGGVVDDRSETWSAADLASLEEKLSDRRFAYRVIILERAFPGAEPADAEQRFAALADEYLASAGVPKGGVLITIALHERLVDFRVWEDGDVQSAFYAARGSGFLAFTDDLLRAFSGPAGDGDLAGAVVAVADRVESLAQAPLPTSPVSPPASGTVRRIVWTPVQIGGVLLGALAVVLSLVQVVLTRRYRRRHQEVLALRDSFVEGLVRMHREELPLARNFDGEESRSHVLAASAASDRAWAAYTQGSERLEKAQRLAGRLQTGAAARELEEVRRLFQEVATAHAEAEQAYAPVAEAIHGWETALTRATGARDGARSEFDGVRQRTQWSLSALEDMWREGVQRQQAGEQARDEDPVMALRLVQEAAGTFEQVRADLARLTEQQKALEAQQQDRRKAEAEIEEVRVGLGLRFVEEDPWVPLRRAAREEERAAQRMEKGDTQGAEEALGGVRSGLAEVRTLLARYREAVEGYSAKREELSAGVRTLPADQATAQGVLDRLSGRFAAEDWADVAALPEELSSLEKRIWSGLEQVGGLARPEEQRYLEAYRLLNQWLGELSALKARLAALTERPARLEEMERQARQNLADAESAAATASARRSEMALLLPADLADEARRLQAQLGEARRLLAARPLPAGRARREAGQALERATALRRAVDELGQRALAARERLSQAQREATAALVYARLSPPHAARLEQGLAMAQEALAAGRYDQALTEAESALQNARALVAAYRRQLAEREAIRQAAMARAAGTLLGQGSRRGGGGRGSGGGGRWGGGGRGSGGGGRWGGGGRGSGGGGRW